MNAPVVVFLTMMAAVAAAFPVASFIVPSRFNTCTHAATYSARAPTATLSMSSAPQSFAGAFDIDQMDALEKRGELEASLMQQASVGILGEQQAKKNSSKKEKNKKEKKQKAAMVARTLRQDGVVQLNGILSEATAAALRGEILERRAAAYAAVETGDDDDEWRKHFADVLLKGDQNQRCDLLLPLKGWRSVQVALHEVLVSSNLLSSTLTASLGGDDATLYELSALISEPGSPRQPVHPDNPHQEEPPLLTVFIALQDITASMGPTTFLPRSHTAEAHAAYNDVPQGRDDLLRSSPNVAALLKAGDASLFDSRALHCGGANDAAEGATRVLLYMSFRNPRATESIGNVGSIMPDIPRMTLAELRGKLAAAVKSDCAIDPFDDEKEREEEIRNLRLAAEGGDAIAQLQLGTNCYLGEGGFKVDASEAVRWFELSAAQGVVRAQFNLGFCHSTGAGVPQGRDLERAAELFGLASEQNHPGAMEAYDETLRELKTAQETSMTEKRER